MAKGNGKYYTPEFKEQAVKMAVESTPSRTTGSVARELDVSRMVRRNMNRRHMIDDHHGGTAARATLLFRAMEEILGTHSRVSYDVKAQQRTR